MHRIDSPGSLAGAWVDRDPVGGIPGTQFVADWMNEAQEELIAPIAAAGMALAKGTNTQLRDAIRILARQEFNPPLTGGTAAAYTAGLTPALTAYPATGIFFVQAHVANTPSPTINFDARGGKNIVRKDGTGIPANDMVAGGIYGLLWDGANMFLVNPASLDREVPSVRQTALAGGVDANGYANFLAAHGGALAIDLAATAAPLVVAFAAGFDQRGAVDYIKRISADVASAWNALTANSTLYLYMDRDVTTGALTYGFSALVPVYQYAAPGAPAADQHWFDLSSMQMKRWSGAAWVAFHRVFVGECVTGAATVTSVITYALQGQYDSGWINTLPAAATLTVKSSNLGVESSVVELFVKNLTAELGYTVGDIIKPHTTQGTVEQPVEVGVTRSTIFTTSGTSGWAALHKTTGGGVGLVLANWAYRLINKRGW